ncbi:hypothetical protein BDV96DRAFT_490441 [Lophiotrema nucula]|uniref:NAD(P)-binding protein n=1 Tax=Lophiotrema nucula TaxID=690887 RepID=A0A6A5ZCP0_9PLEO|nr:hypothetical protein BDV96DRAFT_490441 [Lophiotrema nucula]
MSWAFVKSIWTQWYPPPPTFTEKDLQDQTGKVFIITGANSGIGFELAKLLYPHGATIYLAGRNEARMNEAIDSIKSSSHPATPAILKYLYLDLEDLQTVRSAVQAFTAQESKLDVLWNNAGMACAPPGTSTKQGFEGHVGTNCIAPLLFTQLLVPQLRNAAEDAPKGSVRVVWTGSAMVDTHSKPAGVDFTAIEAGKTIDAMTDYASSKVGNWFLCNEAAKAWGPYGVYSVVQNPGNLTTRAYRYQPWLLMKVVNLFVLYPAVYGAYTLLYSAFDGEVQNGEFIWPWGRKARSERKDIHEAIEKGAAERFWTWCEEKGRTFA